MTPNITCPVCGKSAEDISDADFDGRSVRCSICKDYDIADRAYDDQGNEVLGRIEKKLRALNMEDRKAALKRAKKSWNEGKRPCISDTSF